MLEIPEAKKISEQMNENLKGRVIESVIANHSPHKFAWFVDDPEDYDEKLQGKEIISATNHGGMVEVHLSDDMRIVLGDGVALRLLTSSDKLPKKHQLLIQFDDDTKLIGSVQMYGGMWCYKEGSYQNIYHEVARKKPSPLSTDFDESYFEGLVSAEDVQNKSVKAFLATEQRIPGLGNGVLQDILFNAKLHPKRKVKTLSQDEKEKLYDSIKLTLLEMVINGGRDTEKDLFGCYGGYKTKLSKKTVNQPCPNCGEPIVKKAYLGGSIYYCSNCQKE